MELWATSAVWSLPATLVAMNFEINVGCSSSYELGC